MGWFENQIEERKKTDQQLLEDSFVKISSAVMGKRIAEKINDKRIVTKNAIDEILKYYHCKAVDYSGDTNSMNEQLELCLRPYGFMHRNVELTEGWYRDAYGPILTFMKSRIGISEHFSSCATFFLIRHFFNIFCRNFRFV